MWTDLTGRANFLNASQIARPRLAFFSAATLRDWASSSSDQLNSSDEQVSSESVSVAVASDSAFLDVRGG